MSEGAPGTPAGRVRCDSIALVTVGDAEPTAARVELEGGRHRHSVGGQMAEGLRWWTGRIEWLRNPVEVRSGADIVIELRNGHRARAIVERGSRGPTDEIGIVGVGPPPFDVDAPSAT